MLMHSYAKLRTPMHTQHTALDMHNYEHAKLGACNRNIEPHSDCAMVQQRAAKTRSVALVADAKAS